MNPWMPIKNPLELKQLGKLGEEASELGSAVCRCIIQGVNEQEPVTGKFNKVWLEEEIADVIASMNRVIKGQKLDLEFIMSRAAIKEARLVEWEGML